MGKKKLLVSHIKYSAGAEALFQEIPSVFSRCKKIQINHVNVFADVIRMKVCGLWIVPVNQVVNRTTDKMVAWFGCGGDACDI